MFAVSYVQEPLFFIIVPFEDSIMKNYFISIKFKWLLIKNYTKLKSTISAGSW